MKISASMACLPGLPLPFVGGVALAVQTVGVSERYVPSCCTEHRRATEWLMASLRPVVRFRMTRFMECLVRSFRLNIRCLNDRPPFLDLGLVEGGEALRGLLLARGDAQAKF